MKEPVSIANANGGFPSGPFHEASPLKLTKKSLEWIHRGYYDCAYGYRDCSGYSTTRLDREGTSS